MCHKKLSFDFGNNVNFVIGHNGSEFEFDRRVESAVFALDGYELSEG